MLEDIDFRKIDANVLIINGDKKDTDIYLKTLKEKGCNVHISPNFSNTEKIIIKQSFDIIITDIILGNHGVIGLLKVIKDVNPDVQIIIITGNPSVSTATEALRIGAYDYLVKPVTPNVLLRVVKRAIETKRLKDEKRKLEHQNQLYRENLEKLLKKEKKRLDEVELEQIRLVAALEQSSESIMIMDTNKIVRYVNPAFEVITGYKISQSIGKHIKMLTDNLDDNEIWEAIENGKVWNGNIISKREDGSLFIEDATISPIRNPEGEIINYVKIGRDVTEKKRLENLASTMNMMDSIGYIFTGIRHELGNPINSLKMTITVLKANLDKFSNDMIHEFLTRMLKDISRIEYLLNALRNFNMFEKPKIQKFKLNELMKNFLSMVEEDFKKNGIKIKMNVIPEDIYILVDPRGFHQIMLNIFTNAANAITGKNSPLIIIDSSKINDFIKIKIIDNGSGIPPAHLKDIFKPFFTTRSNGTGMGLVIVKKLLSEMDSTIKIDSKLNEGTTVEISIPLAK